jgi:hypothetical protein
MTKQRLVVHLTNRVSVKGTWTTELAEPLTLDKLQKVGDGVNAGITLTVELPNGDFETFNTAHVVGVESQTWREPKPHHYGPGSAFDQGMNVPGDEADNGEPVDGGWAPGQGTSLPANDDDNYGQDED